MSHFPIRGKKLEGLRKDLRIGGRYKQAMDEEE